MRALLRVGCPLLVATALCVVLFELYALDREVQTETAARRPVVVQAQAATDLSMTHLLPAVAEALNETLKRMPRSPPNVENLVLTQEDYQVLLEVKKMKKKRKGTRFGVPSFEENPLPVEELLAPISDDAPHRQTYALDDWEVDYVHALLHSHPYPEMLLRWVKREHYVTPPSLPRRGNGQRRHADARFFRGIVPLPIVQNISLTMFKEVSDMFRRHGVAHWLCSGALIGYHYSGGLLPWDDDVDIQMIAMDLYKLRLLKLKMDKYALAHNVSDRYYFDFNPFHIFRDYQAQHRVDLKVIDTKTGCTMDVMAVHPVHGSGGRTWNTKYPQKKLHPEYPYLETLSGDALFPVRPCVFEGIPTFCPHNVSKHLLEDYGPSVLEGTKAALFNFSYDPIARKFNPVPSTSDS